MRLMRADFYRLLKDRAFYLLLAVLIAFSLVVSYIYHYVDTSGTMIIGDVILRCMGADTLCTILAWRSPCSAGASLSRTQSATRSAAEQAARLSVSAQKAFVSQ